MIHIETGTNLGNIGPILAQYGPMGSDPESIYRAKSEKEIEENPNLFNQDDVMLKDECKVRMKEMLSQVGPAIFETALNEIREEI